MSPSVGPPHAHVLEKNTKVEEFKNLDYTTEWAEFSRNLDQFRIHHSLEKGQGVEEFYTVSDGVFLRTLDLYHRESQGEAKFIAIGGQLVLAFKLEGENELLLGDGRRHLMKPGSLTVGYSDSDIVREDRHVAGERFLMVFISLMPKALLEAPFSQSLEDLPQIIRGMFDHPSKMLLEGLIIDLDMIRALQDLLACDIKGPLRRTYIEAKVIELICLALHAMNQRDSANARSSFSPHDLESLEKIKSQLQRLYCSPPSMAELAGSAGMSDSKLRRCFKGLFGVSISEFVLQLRMQRAQEELSIRDSNINQIADKLGYSHACNFTTAFKNRFGLTPKAYQKQLTSGLEVK